ncbi:hypothetical protein [Minwuia sp.]|uniref:hypothetical protein n=1 Tax=Minwuia sp. TaxID=2493630 RepID=UPI003A8EEDB8
MAVRKATMSSPPARPRLDELLARAKTVTLSEDDLREQQASFVYGNAPKGSKITKESARAAIGKIRLTGD